MRIKSGHIAVAIIALIGLFVILAASRVTTQAAPKGPEPSAAIPGIDDDPTIVPIILPETTEFEVGPVANDKPTRHPFTVHNKGKANLHLTSIKTSCACTEGILPQNGLIIPPGQQATFDIQVDPRRIPGFKTRKILTIASNDPKTPQIQLGVTTNVSPEFEIDPEEINLGTVKKGDQLTRTLIVRQLQDTPLEITDINTFGNNKTQPNATDLIMHYERRPEDQWRTPGKVEYEITIGPRPEVPAGPLNRMVFLVTNVKRLPAFPIPLNGILQAPYTIDPAAPKPLTLSPDPATRAPQPATITITAETPIELVGIAPGIDTLTVTPLPQLQPNTAQLEISATPGAPTGPIDSEVRFLIKTPENTFPERVPVRGFIPPTP